MIFLYCFAVNLVAKTVFQQNSVVLLHLQLPNFKSNLYDVLVLCDVIFEFHDVK